jgi:hypothetical protein
MSILDQHIGVIVSRSSIVDMIDAHMMVMVVLFRLFQVHIHIVVLQTVFSEQSAAVVSGDVCI